MPIIKAKKLQKNAILPKKAHEDDAGYDLYANVPTFIPAFSRHKVGTGIAVAIPKGYAGFVQPRSGLAAKSGITVLNTPGLIDPGYRGEVKVILYNTTNVPYTVEIGQRIAQLVIVYQGPVPNHIYEYDELDDTERQTSGFGSTGS